VHVARHFETRMAVKTLSIEERLAWPIAMGRIASTHRGWLVPVALALMVITAGCDSIDVGRLAKTGDERKVRVVCTTGMVADLAERIGGPFVEVRALMGEGVDPHLYKASPGDVRALVRSDLIFYSGHHLEGKMGEVFRRLARRKPTIAVTEGIDPSRLLDFGGGKPDPHLWFDVALWSNGVKPVYETLTKFDPKHAAIYEQNACAYLKELTELDEECRLRIASIPKPRRVLVTAHDAFGYFGRAYGLEVRGIQGISTESEAGVREVNDLVELLTSRRIPAVFVETSVSDRNIQALVEGCHARGHSLKIGGSLFSDAMGRPGTPEGTYVGMVRHNVATISEALR
jgi:manganese/zinc/iron transport system substrate-binding protein